MVNSVIFQIGVATGGIAFVIWFADMLDRTKKTDLKVKILGALFLYSVSLFTILIPATTETIKLLGFRIPPLQVWFEAVTMGFIISSAWQIFYENI